LSSGMFVYSVKTKKNLPLGTQIKNKAAIYFDYNAPIITNTTLNTLVASAPSTNTAIQEIKQSGSEKLRLFPNPTNGDFILAYDSRENETGTICIIDISGREVSNHPVRLTSGENSLEQSTSQLQNGIYLVQLKTSTETITKKLAVAK
jgi:hypothetical protein